MLMGPRKGTLFYCAVWFGKKNCLMGESSFLEEVFMCINVITNDLHCNQCVSGVQKSENVG